MTTLAMLLKSYEGDHALASRLIASFTAHNVTGIPLYCVVPEADVALFTPLASEHVTVMAETPLADHFVTEPLHGIRIGYINQEIVKLSFHELGLADNYFCVDSDAVFVRDFTPADFIAPDGYPYTVLVEDNELKVEPRYYREYWQPREQHLRTIANTIELDDPVIRSCHGHQVFSAAVLRSFVGDFLAPRGWTYRDALAVAPYEFSWYSLWLQKAQTIPIHQREPLVKVFHNEDQHLEYILRGVTEADIARGYLALVVNSNFAREVSPTAIGAGKPQALAPYLSYGEVASLLNTKARDTLRRRLRRQG